MKKEVLIPIAWFTCSTLIAILLISLLGGCASGVHCDAYGQEEVMQLNDVANVEYKQEKD